MTRLNAGLAPDLQSGVARQLAEMQKQTASQSTMAQAMIGTQQGREAQAVVAEAQEQAKPAAQQDTTVTNAALSSELDAVVDDKVRAYDLAWSNQFVTDTPIDAGHAVIQRHEPYCSADEAALGRCKTAAIPALQDADLTINTIYQPGNGQYDTLSDQEHAAALAFVTNVTQPVAYPVPNARTQGPSAQLTAELAQDQATLALVAHSFNAQIAERTRRHQ
ncbi:MAG: hypothetical protein EPN79_15800 [Burkholderiaceae bacterium]|nr:MAG: hypothetical protein EPN79_15800 [Burkholderiaceae bacterium]